MLMMFRASSAFRILVLVAVLAALIAGIAGVNGTAAVQPAEAEAESALAWLIDQQLDNGAFPGFDGEADPSNTAEAIFALASAGIHPATVKSSSGGDPVSYVLQQAGELASMDPVQRAGAVSKAVLVLHAAGLDPRTAVEDDLIELLNQGFDTEAGTYGAGLFVHSLAVLALSAEDEELVEGAIQTIVDRQHQDGGWSFTGGAEEGTADSNTTAIVIQALAHGGGQSNSIERGVEYLMSLQAADGSFAYDASSAPEIVGDANSTAMVIQALTAAGHDLDSLPGGNPVAALTAFQNQSGAFHWQAAFPDDNFFATVQAIPALLLKPLPIGTVPAPDPADDLRQAMLPVEPLAGCVYYEITGHNLCDPFTEFWNANGGLRIFGYPLSERIEIDGLEVQYFERTVFEYHPDNAGSEWEVLLRRVGADLIDLQLGE